VREDVLYERAKKVREKKDQARPSLFLSDSGDSCQGDVDALLHVVDSRGPGPARPRPEAHGLVFLVPGCVWLGVHPKGRLQPSLFQRRKSIICLCPARPHRNEVVPLFTHISHTTNRHTPHLHPLCCACSCISISHQATPRARGTAFLPSLLPSLPSLSTGGQDTQSSPTHTTITHPCAVVCTSFSHLSLISSTFHERPTEEKMVAQFRADKEQRDHDLALRCHLAEMTAPTVST